MIRRDKVYNKSNPSKKKIKPHRAWVCPEIRTVVYKRELDLIRDKLGPHLARKHPEFNVAQLDATMNSIPWGMFLGKTIANIAIEQGEAAGSREDKDMWAWWLILILFPDKYSADYDKR